MAELTTGSRLPEADVASVAGLVRAFGLPGDDRLDPAARDRLAALVESSAADARPPLASPHRWRRFVARPVKAVLRKLVWSRTGPALERQAEFNTAFIRVATEMLAAQLDDARSRAVEREPVRAPSG